MSNVSLFPLIHEIDRGEKFWKKTCSINKVYVISTFSSNSYKRTRCFSIQAIQYHKTASSHHTSNQGALHRCPSIRPGLQVDGAGGKTQDGLQEVGWRVGNESGKSDCL